MTFDLWNTLLKEVSSTISHDRAHLIFEEFERTCPELKLEDIQSAIERAWTLHRSMWVRGEIFRNEAAAAFIASDLCLGDSIFVARVIEGALGYMYAPDRLIPADSLEFLFEKLTRAKLKIGLICDTGFTPGSVLVERLKELGFARYFSGFSFSNEIGAYKPDPSIFLHSLSYLRVDATTVIHVGDLWRNDVLGARQAGFRTIRYSGWQDDKPNECDADFVSSDHKTTAEIVLSHL